MSELEHDGPGDGGVAGVPGATSATVAATMPGALALTAECQPLRRGEVLWRVAGGDVEVYVELADARRLLCVVADGGFVFNVDDPRAALLSVATTGSVRLVPMAPEDVDGDELARAADHWVASAAELLTSRRAAPETAAPLAAGEQRALAPGEQVRAVREPLWVRLGPGEPVRLLGPDVRVTGPALVAVCAGLCVQAERPITVTGISSRKLGDNRVLVHELGAFTVNVVAITPTVLAAEEQGQIQRMSSARVATAARVSASVSRLTSVVHTASDGAGFAEGATPLASALAALCARLSIPLDASRLGGVAGELADASQLGRRVGVRTRRVVLDEGWWRHELGPLLAAREDGGDVVALLPQGTGRYLVFEPARGGWHTLSTRDARALSRTAYAVYRPMLAQVSGVWEVVRFLLHDIRPDMAWVIIVGLVGGLLGTVVPIMTAVIIDHAIPGAERPLLWQLGVAMGAAALVSLVLSTVREVSLHRIDGRSKAALTVAIWDRLLRLPPGFFRGYSAGDLSQRVAGLEAVRRTVVDTALGATLVMIFTLFNAVLLFIYDARLALIAAVLVLIYATVTFTVGMLQLRHEKAIAKLDGEIAGLVFQYLQGVTKLRVAGAEARAFSRWADRYAVERQATVRAGRLRAHFEAFATSWPLITSLVFFAAVGYVVEGAELSAGIFIAFLAAFGAFQAAFLGFAQAALSVLAALPHWERAKALLDTPVESDATRRDPGPLSGSIDITGVSFSYEGSDARVLEDVSLRVTAGRSVAFVGPSGSGKSTLLRLLLGFERPTRGTILYDGQDLRHLDLSQLRRQMGVVLQSSRVFAGSVYENIRGAAELGLEECAHAARAAGLAADLAEWPMGLHTPLTEGGDTLSGGQRQRLLIARAIAASPKVLFLDEATSALDNLTQALVTDTLERLGCTRLLVAHRLSTVRNADLICFLDKGRILEQGSFDELMARDGEFAKFARRQMS